MKGKSGWSHATRWWVGLCIIGVVLTIGKREQTHASPALLAAAAPTASDVRVNPKDGLKYVRIPAGTFTMGCSPGDEECQPDEKPAHAVAITKDFWIGQTELTVGAYKRFLASTGQQI